MLKNHDFFVILQKNINNCKIMRTFVTIKSIFIRACFFSVFCACTSSKTISIHNRSPLDRTGCVAEMDLSLTGGISKYGLVVEDGSGKRVPYQITHDQKLLFSVDIPAESAVKYKLYKSRGAQPEPYDTVCLAQIRHDFQDDLTWENDRGGYRLYGPAYKNGGGNVSGYDIWTKSVAFPVLAQRYFDHCQRGISYHKDHGNGMDAYTVGPTLGAGMNVLMMEGTPVYPCAYESCEILDNGPFRTSIKINCYPMAVGTDTVRETRIITLDKGSWLNKTEIKYDGLRTKMQMANGIVVHKQNPRGYSVSGGDRGYMAYADLTDNANNGNGVIYIGVVNTVVPDSAGFQSLDPSVGDAIGQVMSHTVYTPGDNFTYYWGSGWSKGGVRGMQAWEKYLSDFSSNLDYPLEITVK